MVQQLMDRDGDGIAEEDIFKVNAECRQDDLYRFYEGGIYEELEGTTKCVETDPAIILKGSWTIEQGGELLKMLENGILVNDFRIINMEITFFKVQYVFSETVFEETYQLK